MTATNPRGQLSQAAWRAALVVILAAVTSVGCGAEGATPTSVAPAIGTPAAEPAESEAPLVTAPADCVPAPPQRLVPQVVAELTHDPAAFTQGLVFLGDRLFESTGLRGESSLRELDPATGAVLRRSPVPGDAFAEGVAVGPDGRLVQLTWTEGIAFVRDPASLEVVGEHRYGGEGWGLTTLPDGRFVQSDGSDTLTFRDPVSFEPTGRMVVQRADGPVDQLNELEWSGGHVWANRWRTDEIVRIDLRCGSVDAVADTSDLSERVAASPVRAGAPAPDVVNGIATIPGTDRYLVSGKRWPTTFDVRLVPA